ncbi:hypothetical protein BB560_000663 [Smittium megazygosporum]|uniref:Eukaryotic translation initiation factor 3 subunit G n=1 Tax=Smittium megazygosporum TaxID=133381 RepID=A0A2T9ZJQ9_9FUNG|nr:hypothetical protein BB560_000663 [Smittium megazygosporum]
MNGTSWADEPVELELNTPQLVFDQDGVKVFVEYKINEEGRKVKVTKKIQNKVIKHSVIKSVAERKAWQKFGEERGKPPGPSTTTTTVGDHVNLKLFQWGDVKDEEAELLEKKKEATVNHIKCKYCKGNHFSAKCPYKDSLKNLEDIVGPSAGAGADSGAPASPLVSGKDAGPQKSAYVPPHRKNPNSARDTSYERSEDLPTIRLTNLPPDTREPDIQNLVRPFGSISRIFLAKDRETGLCKGYSFISFDSRQSAENAINKLHRHGFGNLILNAEWSGNSK